MQNDTWDDRTAMHVTEHSNNVTASLQSSWKTISGVMTFSDDEDDVTWEVPRVCTTASILYAKIRALTPGQNDAIKNDITVFQLRVLLFYTIRSRKTFLATKLFLLIADCTISHQKPQVPRKHKL